MSGHFVGVIPDEEPPRMPRVGEMVHVRLAYGEWMVCLPAVVLGHSAKVPTTHIPSFEVTPDMLHLNINYAGPAGHCVQSEHYCRYSKDGAADTDSFSPRPYWHLMEECEE